MSGDFWGCPTLATPCTIAHQALLSVRFSRQEYWSGLPFPPSGDGEALQAAPTGMRALPGLPKGPMAALRCWPATCPPSQPLSQGARSPPAPSLPLLLSGCQQPEDGEDLRWLWGPGFGLASPLPSTLSIHPPTLSPSTLSIPPLPQLLASTTPLSPPTLGIPHSPPSLSIAPSLPHS